MSRPDAQAGPGPRQRYGLALLLSLLLVCVSVDADDRLEARVQIGISLLPAVGAANQSLSKKNPNIPLPVYVVYDENRHAAERVAPELAKMKPVRGHPVAVSSVSLDELLASSPTPMSIVFIAEKLDDKLDLLVRFGEERRLLLFSPHRGDVERGVTAGFRVTDRVLPMVNMNYLNKTNIRMKAFFLRIAVKHE